MSPYRRALLGSALGALLVLIIHPASRPVYVSWLAGLGGSETITSSPYLPENIARLRPPRSLVDAGYWMLVAAETDNAHERLSASELRQLERMAAAVAVQDPDNAFWLQMRAVWLWKLGERAASKAAWSQAANAVRWNDMQSDRLSVIAEGLRQESGGQMAWHYAYLYSRRSVRPAHMIELLAANLCRGLPLDTPDALSLRYQTLLNGKRLREGGRSIETSLCGVNMERAAFLADTRQQVTPKEATESRFKFLRRLTLAGRDAEARSAIDEYGQTDAWLALVRPAENMGNVSGWTLVALASVLAPSVFLLVGIVGGLIYSLGALLERQPRMQTFFRTPIAPLAGIVLALLVFRVTNLVSAALWTLLALGLFCFEPNSPREADAKASGFVFQATLFLLSIVFVLFGGLYLAGMAAPGQHLLPMLGVPPEYAGESVILVAVAGIMVGLVLVTALLCALVLKFEPCRIAGPTLTSFGRLVGLIGLTAAVASGPLAVYGNSLAYTNLKNIVENEPTYYLIQ